MKPINYQHIEDKFRHLAKTAGCKFHSMFVEKYYSKIEIGGEEVVYDHASLIVTYDANRHIKRERRKLRFAAVRLDMWLDKKYDDYFCLKINYYHNASELEQIYP